MKKILIINNERSKVMNYKKISEEDTVVGEIDDYERGNEQFRNITVEYLQNINTADDVLNCIKKRGEEVQTKLNLLTPELQHKLKSMQELLSSFKEEVEARVEEAEKEYSCMSQFLENVVDSNHVLEKVISYIMPPPFHEE